MVLAGLMARELDGGRFAQGLAALAVLGPTPAAAQSAQDKLVLTLDECLAQATTAKEQHMCKSQHLAEFNQRFPNAAE